MSVLETAENIYTEQKTKRTNQTITIDWKNLCLIIKWTEETSMLTKKKCPNSKTNGRTKTLSKDLLFSSPKELVFQLTEVNIKRIVLYRKKNIPSFVLKKDGKYYHTQIPKDLVFNNANIFTHLCGESCSNISPLLCEKVRFFSTGIELYPFISEGYETFGTLHTAFVVSKCSNHCCSSPGTVTYKTRRQQATRA